MNRCEKYELLLIERDAAPNELPRGSAAELDAHLAECADCRAFARELEGSLSPARLRAELPARDPGDAFFVRTRNVVFEATRAQQRAAAPARPASAPRAGFFARIYEALFVQRRGLATAGVALAAVAVITVALWPRAVKPPPFIDPSLAGVAAQQNEEQAAESEGLLAEVGSLSNDEMKHLASQLVIETPELRGSDIDDEPDAVETSIESLSPDELKALDAKIALATREAKGA